MSAACEALGAARLCADGVADDSVSRTTPGVAADDFAHWRDHHLTPALLRVVTQPDAFQADADSQRRERRAHLQSLKEREEKEADDKAPPSPSPEEDVDADDPQPSRAAPSKVVDLEELGQTIHKGGGLPVSKARAERKEEAVSTVRIHSRVAEGAPVVAPRPMLTAALRGALGKQGYKLIGSHSGVKLCRWTKAMLRGRGGCYKHSFYGQRGDGEQRASHSCVHNAQLPDASPHPLCDCSLPVRHQQLAVHGDDSLSRLRQQVRPCLCCSSLRERCSLQPRLTSAVAVAPC